jgi:hypothetical protein
MMVSASAYTWLVGCTYSPCIIAVPKRLIGDMTSLWVFFVFEVTCGKIFPGTMVFSFMLIGNSGFNTSWI